MAQPNIPLPTYADVPNVLGVPQMARSVLFPPTLVKLVVVGAIQKLLWRAASAKPAWGILDLNNKPVLVPDSIMDFDSRNEWRVSDFPVQEGGFASYNKVASPFEISVRLIKGGTQSDRATFLQRLDDIARTLSLYTILTPERIYRNCNVTRYEVSRRGSGGAYFLSEVDLFFREIRQVAAQYSSTAVATQNAKEPSAQPTTNQGSVQPQAASPVASAGVAAAVAQVPR